MAESRNIPNNVSENDTLDINELASLDGEVTADFIDQLQNQISSEANIRNDGDLFEELPSKDSKKGAEFNKDIDDNFIKKYKAKLQKQQNMSNEAAKAAAKAEEERLKAEEEARLKAEAEAKLKAEEEARLKAEAEAKSQTTEETTGKNATDSEAAAEVQNVPQPETRPGTEMQTEAQPESAAKDDSISTISGGNINEHPISLEQANYKESLNYLDNNVKYSKYVIYIDPENKEFIDGLTVKERKNLINRIIREQDAISLTKRKLSKMQAIITHVLIAITTITIAIPILYWAVNASLEATINNYRQSQSAFEMLYKDKGKLKRN